MATINWVETLVMKIEKKTARRKKQREDVVMVGCGSGTRRVLLDLPPVYTSPTTGGGR